MGRKSRAKSAQKSCDPKEAATEPEPTSERVEPICRSGLEAALVLVAIATVALVALVFSLNVNRVFDIPKALALKVGGCSIFAVWLAYGLLGKGFAWGSIRLFVAPVFALLAAIGVATALSIDPWMSLVGVYERQFGFQGQLACVGLFVVAATCLRSRRGAAAGLATLIVLGGIVSSYAWLQSRGVDPYEFFKQPHNKVYSTLGNATFAGNSLALIFPISLVIASVASVLTLRPARWEDAGVPAKVGTIAYAVGFAAMIGLHLVPTYLFAASADAEFKRTLFKFGIGASIGALLFCAAVGSWGFEWARLETKRGRQLADAAGAGALSSMVVAMVLGLWSTRTRGAWVGTGGAVVMLLALLPLLFKDERARFRKAATITWGTMGVLVVAVVLTLFVIAPNHLFSRTLKSIPYAFMPDKTVYGQGQGTRRYLWAESPRVLFNHGATLERIAKDREDLFARVPEAERPPDVRDSDWLGPTIRKLLVFPFGIGMETYRYAFMSHKSKLLEALDPMTNHDNPHNNYLYVLASYGIFGLLAYAWLLWRLLSTAWRRFTATELSRTDRAIALGVVTSFTSYAGYSIAGFDSVACSVFLYFLLGCTAVYFAPTFADGARRPILVHARRQWHRFRGRPDPAPSTVPVGVTIAVAAVLGIPLLHSLHSIQRIYRADSAFVQRSGRTYDAKIKDTLEAIALNPEESFYRQNLGSTYAEAARTYRRAAGEARQRGETAKAKGMLAQGRKYLAKSETALHAALNHAWAPENIFIAQFQGKYAWQQPEEAERALERALEHSPHLGPVRANLAVLKLTHRKAYEEALVDCLWVLDVDPNNMHALRTCARSYHQLGKLDEAKVYFDRAKKKAPRDPTLAAYLRDYDRSVQAAKTASSAGAKG